MRRPTNTGVNIRPIPPMHSAPHGSHCLSRGLTWSVKSTLEKQTRQPSLALQQCMSVAISWAKKVQSAKCDISVGFPKSSHI